MKRDLKRAWQVGRGGKGEPRRAAGPAAQVTAAEFLTLLKRGRLADPGNAELRAGRTHRVRPPKGQAAGVLQRLQAELQRAVAGTGAHVAAGPLVRLGAADLWRPRLSLYPARGASALTAPGGTLDGGALLLAVELSGASEVERLAAYAAAGVREVWCLALCEGWTVRYRSPWAGRYQSRTLWYPGESVPVMALPGVQVEALEEGFVATELVAGGPDCRSGP